MMEPTFADRMKAARIVQELRLQSSRGDIGRLLGLDNTYVSFIEHKMRRWDNPDTYLAPKWTIERVLEWERANGKR